MSISVNHPMVTHEQWENFTEQDHNTWSILFKRQSKVLKHRAVNEISKNIEKLEICEDKIPKFLELNKILNKETGFSIAPVKGFIPEDLFFKFLSERKFPSTCFIRKPEQLDYLEEPDIFHDVFGHIPLLINPVFADFMEEFGHKGLQSIEAGILEFAATLYWFTVEFGLINTQKGLRIYGAGIVSSKSESLYSLESSLPTRIKFNDLRAMKTKYHIDSLQKTYFVIKNFNQLFNSLKNINWHILKDFLPNFPDIEQEIATNNEEII